MRESSAIQNLANYAAPQLRKRIPVTGTNWPTAKARYQRVLGQLATLRHDNVEAVHEVHFDPPKDCYLVCERLEGDALSAVIERERRLPLETVRSITRQIANALMAAHHLGVMHGNLSPQAIVVQRSESSAAENSLRIKVCDFGMGKALGPELFGALGYLAPEQVDPKEPRPEPTPLSDQFALAVIAFELLAGRRAFSGETLEEITPKLLRQDPIHFQIPGISRKESARIISGLHKALSRLPSERYVNLTEFVAALEPPTKNKGSRSSVLDQSRFAADHQAPIKIEASVAQALAVAARQFPGPLDPPRPMHDVPTLTTVHLGGQHSAHQAATQPMMPRLEFQFNVQTTVANRNDSHLNIIMPPPPSAKPMQHPGMRLRRYLLAALIGALVAAGSLMASMHPFFASHPRDIRPEPTPDPPSALQSVVEPMPLPTVTPVPSSPPQPTIKLGPRHKPPPKPKRPKFALECTPTHKLGAALSQHISACSSNISENFRDTVLVLPVALAQDGHPMLGMNDEPQGPPALIKCLRDFVASSHKSVLGTLPRTGLVLHCTLQ